MNIKIGENIRLYRKQNNITQEQLAKVFNVSTVAVSKWESGNTYPDITLLFPIANYFSITLDELMGYNVELMENEICHILDEYDELPNNLKYSGENELIVEARKKYPHDLRIMHKYMFEIMGGVADNNSQIIIKRCDELQEICETLLNACEDEKMRLDALTTKAKILHARGKTTEAVSLLNTFPSFYHSSNQRKEQLFNKDTLEYYEELILNLHELARLTADKLAKSIIYNPNFSYEEKIEKIDEIGNGISHANKNCDSNFFNIFEKYFWCRIISHPYPQLNYDKDTLKRFIGNKKALDAYIE